MPYIDIVQMRFNPNLLDFIAPDQLDAQFGGEHHYEFEFESFWAQIVEYVASCSVKFDTDSWLFGLVA